MLFGFFIALQETHIVQPINRILLYNLQNMLYLTVCSAFSFSSQNAFAPILHRRHPAVLFEFSDQMARVGKAHIVGDFLDRHTAVRHQILDPFHSVSVYILPEAFVEMRLKITSDIPLG